MFFILWLVALGYAVDQEYPADGPAVTECYSASPAMACENDRDKPAKEPATKDVPDAPDGPDVPDTPDDEPDGKPDGKPGWGKGDKNHDHKGPRGQEKK